MEKWFGHVKSAVITNWTKVMRRPESNISSIGIKSSADVVTAIGFFS